VRSEAMTVEVKICGLKSAEMIETAIDAGADFVGFVFFPRSPRNLRIAEAEQLAPVARRRAGIVALLVDADDALIDEVAAKIRPDLLQLHGNETPERVAAIRSRTGIPIMKVLKVADAADLVPVASFVPHVDRFLFDAKPPKTLEGALPGGNGISFDWRLMKDFDAGRPAMLSGGLDASNVGEAIRLTGMRSVDVSSGVERAPGEKDADRIMAFIAAARAAL
jgi:phosphoribosylanthranilate isomerase